ncbi:hypothetical protein CPB84DRAFT_1848508 [Gymnopilus junonius]|uniref:Uncharacterized protein n=1 Tax=Gymnopilus junonius TaxID=109634 RepID=A0A9P5NMT6_GYMJU|nr:hypothetical protein CPB84DRAFT_1848508 [Gymnopilus junonius]
MAPTPSCPLPESLPNSSSQPESDEDLELDLAMQLVLYKQKYHKEKEEKKALMVDAATSSSSDEAQKSKKCKKGKSTLSYVKIQMHCQIDEFEGLEEDDVEDKKCEFEQSYVALCALFHLVPKFQKKLDEGNADEIANYYADLKDGANHGCSDNAGEEEYDWLRSFHVRVFYYKFKDDQEHLEDGFLKSSLLVKVFKHIFTLPSLAKQYIEEDSESDADETQPPKKKCKTAKNHNLKNQSKETVAKILHMNETVTPCSIAYAAVQLHFNLQTAEWWDEWYGGFNYEGLHNYIVDFFEDVQDATTKRRVRDLLAWWNMQIFPAAAAHRESNTEVSCKVMKQQWAACSALAPITNGQPPVMESR